VAAMAIEPVSEISGRGPDSRVRGRTCALVAGGLGLQPRTTAPGKSPGGLLTCGVVDRFVLECFCGQLAIAPVLISMDHRTNLHVSQDGIMKGHCIGIGNDLGPGPTTLFPHTDHDSLANPSTPCMELLPGVLVLLLTTYTNPPGGFLSQIVY